jgi:hypothetical protein
MSGDVLYKLVQACTRLKTKSVPEAPELRQDDVANRGMMAYKSQKTDHTGKFASLSNKIWSKSSITLICGIYVIYPRHL